MSLPSPNSPRRSEAGTATVLVMPLLGVVVLATMVASVLGSLLVAQRRVQSAADLAALAGAASVQRREDACAAASTLSRRNRTDLVACAVQGRAVSVEVALEVSGLLGRSVRVRAQARAGPATEGTGLVLPRPRLGGAGTSVIFDRSVRRVDALSLTGSTGRRRGDAAL
ncbi:hypothetical protein BH18ACT9_BH18ACT9_13470 [soil metagenome]